MTARAGWRGIACALLVCVGGCTAIVDGDRFRGHIDGGADGALADGAVDGAVDGSQDAATSDGAVDGALSIDAAPSDGAALDAQPIDGAALDAQPIDAQPIDAQPVDAAIVAITSIEPTQLVEGVGSVAGSAGTPVLFHGLALSGATLTCPAGSVVHCGALTISADGTLAAAVLTADVDPTLADGATRAITLTVTAGGHAATKDITLLGLDELTLAAGDITVTAGSFKPRYSTISLSSAASFRGAVFPRLVATASISVTAAIDASGRGDGTAGAGGCAGGGVGAAGGCAPGGGGGGTVSGTTGSGGGGGGNAATGGAGGSTGGGLVGDPMVTPMGKNGNEARGNGGGGGASGTLGGGGNGGGGGGTIELTSLGSLALGATLTADGGPGQAGSGLCATSGGGGGGGSGGVLLLRAAASLTVSGSGAVRARGGGITNSCSNGGLGADGRIRVDAPTALPTLTGTPGFVRGPMWAAATQITTTALDPVMLIAGSNQMVGWFVNGGVVNTATTTVSGTATVNVPLVSGLNTLCTLVTPTADATKPEATNCRTIAYLP